MTTKRMAADPGRGTMRRRGAVTLAMLAVACQAAPVHAHGGGGFHGGGGGFGGGGYHGGGGFSGGGFSGGRDFGGGDFRGGDFRGGDVGGGDFRGGEVGGGDFRGGDFRGGDVGGRLDGGGALDGRAGGAEFRDVGSGHFAGAGNLSRGDFERIAAGGVGGLAGPRGIQSFSRASLATRGDSIRNNFYNGGWYGGRGWYGNHFPCWWGGGWWGGFGWGMGAGMLAGLAWGDLAGWGGYAAAPVAYDYGSNVCYQDDGVYVGGSRVGSAEEYAQQAATLAESGGASATIAKDDTWRPLGVFALARQEETTPGTFISLAIDQTGLLRGTYYDAVSDSTMNITGKVDKKTQRCAWTVGDKKTPVYEAGLSNLTKQQTTILVHRDGGKVEQMLLVRVDDKAAGGGATTAAQPAAGDVPGAGDGS
jgi:hypothetical protein